MGRTFRFTKGADSFTQGGSPDNVSVSLFMLGGKDKVDLNRTDDFGGGNRVDAGGGDDLVVNRIEAGSIIKLGSGNDTYAGVGFGSFSSDRGDTVFGGGGNDVIAVTTFKSSYNGNKGNDTFITVGAQNRYDGGSGIDTIDYSERDSSAQAGSAVTVDLAARQAQTSANSFETLLRIENVTGTGANDNIFGKGNANVLTGGEGFDELAGRGGADTFVWRSVAEAPLANDNFDLIDDFSAAQRDKIDLRGMDANANVAKDQAFRYINTADFSGKAGELHFQGQFLSGDVDGDGLADFRIGLENVTTLSSGSILL